VPAAFVRIYTLLIKGKFNVVPLGAHMLKLKTGPKDADADVDGDATDCPVCGKRNTNKYNNKFIQLTAAL